MGVSPQAVAPFLANLDMVLTRVTMNQLEIWFQRGMDVLKENPDGGIAYFKVESSTSENLLESLSSSMELERVKPVIRLYCCALSGSSIEVQNSKELASKSIGWVSESAATTEGTKVFLPPVVDRYSTKDNNFGWFKVVSTHQVAHLEFGSFLFEYDRPSNLFDDRRPTKRTRERLHQRQAMGLPHRLQTQSPQPSLNCRKTWETPGPQNGVTLRTWDGSSTFSTTGGWPWTSSPSWKTAGWTFRVKVEYPGIVNHYRTVQRDSREERPPIEELPLLQGMGRASRPFQPRTVPGTACSQRLRKDGPGVVQDFQKAPERQRLPSRTPRKRLSGFTTSCPSCPTRKCLRRTTRPRTWTARRSTPMKR